MRVKIIDTVATANNIRQKSELCGLSPKDIQKELKLSTVQAVYKWFNPNNNAIPSIDNLIMLAGLMECELEDLIVIKELEE